MATRVHNDQADRPCCALVRVLFRLYLLRHQLTLEVVHIGEVASFRRCHPKRG
jgi:hypothetical protein